MFPAASATFVDDQSVHPDGVQLSALLRHRRSDVRGHTAGDDTPSTAAFDQGGAPVTIDPTQPPVPDCYALTTQQKLGLQLFQDKAKCIACHSGPELTHASVQNRAERETGTD